MKTGQIKLMENVAVLFVFFLLIMGGLVFYTNLKQKSYQEKAGEIKVLRFIQTAQKIAFLPEIQCTNDNVPTLNCVDLIKAQQLATLAAADPQSYSRVFGLSKVDVAQVYPKIATMTVYKADCPQCKSNLSIQIPVSIYSPNGTPEYSFGYLNITVMSP